MYNLALNWYMYTRLQLVNGYKHVMRKYDECI